MQGLSVARSVLLAMARDESRAERIRTVLDQRKAEDPTFTLRWISDQIGVSERALSEWKVTGALKRENSDKLAALAHVDPTMLWLGRKEADPPDLLDVLNGAGPSDQVEDIREEFRVDVDKIKDGLAENRRLLAVLLEKLAPAEFANYLEQLADQPAPAAGQPSKPARTEDGRDSQETA